MNDEIPTVKLNIGLNCVSPMLPRARIVDTFGHEEMLPPTLRDISIILYTLCGAGVLRTFANELSKELCVPPEKVREKMLAVVEEYAHMDEYEAYKRTFKA